MELSVLVGSASRNIGARLCAGLQVVPVPLLQSAFPDGELDLAVCAPLRGDDVYIVQATSPPVEQHLMELLLLADASRRLGAGRITAVVPYFGYARHDRRSAPGAAVAVRVVGDVLRAAGVDRFVTVDPHIATLEAVVGAPLERVSAVQPLAQTLRSLTGPDAVIVAPDLGAVKLARRFGRELELDTAFVDKRRLSGSEVRASAVIGDVRGRRPVIVDDMISTGGTVIEAARALRDAGASGDLIVAATHGLFAAPAGERFEHLAPAAVITTDTVEQPLGLVPRSDKVSVVGLLTDAVRALHEHRALDGVAVFD